MRKASTDVSKASMEACRASAHRAAGERTVRRSVHDVNDSVGVHDRLDLRGLRAEAPLRGDRFLELSEAVHDGREPREALELVHHERHVAQDVRERALALVHDPKLDLALQHARRSSRMYTHSRVR